MCHIYTHATIVIQCATFVNWWALSALLICHSGSFTPSWCHGRSCVAHLKTQYVPVHDVSRIYTHDFDLVSHTCELAGSRCPTDVPFQAGALADPVSHVCDPACHICELAGSWCPTIPDPQVCALADPVSHVCCGSLTLPFSPDWGQGHQLFDGQTHKQTEFMSASPSDIT